MTRVNAQPQRQDYVVSDSASVKANHQVPDSILVSKDTVTPKELEDISMFSNFDENNTALEIGGAVLGGAALVFAAKKMGLGKTILSKVFPVMEENGLQYRKFLGKKYNLRLSSTEYQPIKLADESLVGQRVKNPHPTNLRNELERCKYNDLELLKLLRENPNLSRTVGSLPSGWAKNFKSAEVRHQVDEILSKYASEFHAVEEGSLPSIKRVQEELTHVLGTEVKIQGLGGGKIGSAYKISAFGEDCVYKVYFNKPMMGFINHGEHGNYSELIAAIQAKKQAPEKFAEFYMGKFGKKHDGYILTKFIPDAEKTATESTEVRFKFSELLRRMVCGDSCSNNVVNGVVRDYGLVGFTDYSKLSPKAQKIARELFPVLDGKSPEKVAKIAQKHSGKQEFEEVKTYLNYIVENKYRFYPEVFASKKSHLQALDLDFKPDIRSFFNRKHRCALTDYNEDYGITLEQALEFGKRYY